MPITFIFACLFQLGIILAVPLIPVSGIYYSSHIENEKGSFMCISIPGGYIGIFCRYDSVHIRTHVSSQF